MNFDPVRSAKIEDLESKKINPYPYNFKITSYIEDVVKEHKLGQDYRLAGRLKLSRPMGKITFADLWGNNVKLQISLDQGIVGEESYEFFGHYIDSGDILGVEGQTYRTKRGELTLSVKDLQLLSKALLHIPSDWSGVTDPDKRIRQRYVDMIANPKSFDKLKQKALINREIRRYLNDKGFLEVETPALQPIYGGASADPFKTLVNELGQDWYLRISPELYLKRYIVGGFEKVYEISKNFRNESIDTTHNPEFTMMEAYCAFADYNDMMKLTEEMIYSVSKAVIGTAEIDGINLSPPWKRISMFDAFKEWKGIDIESVSDSRLKQMVLENKLELRSNVFHRGTAIEQLFEVMFEKQPTPETTLLKGPVFITDHPVGTTPLCKVHRDNPRLIERFEPYINFMEIGNAYTELNDPRIQLKEFQEQLRRKHSGAEGTHVYDEDFVRALSYGMPPTGGLGIGIDRLAMVLTNSSSIKDVIGFPFAKKIEDLMI